MTKTRIAGALLLSLAGCSSQPGASPPVDGSAGMDAGKDARIVVGEDAHTAPDSRPVDAARPADAAHPHDVTKPDGHVGTDAAAPHDATADHPSSPPDALPSEPVVALGTCVGTSMPLTISSQSPYVDVSIGSEAGEFILDFGSTFSSIDLSTFTSPGPATSGCDPNDLGELCTFADFGFFAAGSVQLTTESYGDQGAGLVQSGIIGTDLLSDHVITLDYAGGHVYAASSSAFCSASALGAVGFLPLSVAGFYENDVSLLEPASDVESGASSGETVPDVPTVPVKIAGVSAVAQLDTGFDDDVTPFSVNINKAFYAAIVAAMPGALVRDSADDETLSTCVDDVSESAEAYTLAAGASFDFVTASGGTARSYAQAVVFVKGDPSAAESCGGIGTWSAPAAQVGASFYVDMKALVFDPYGAKVWIPKQ